MRRRHFIMLLGAAVAAEPEPVYPQAKKVHRLAIASPVEPTVDLTITGHLRGFFERMHSHGHVEGRNLVVERYSAGGRTEQFAGMAREVVRSEPDAILTWSTPLTREFKQATDRIPIVSFTADPVGSGLVASQARPGGNITGVGSEPAGPSLIVKRAAILKEAVPGASRVGFLGFSPAIGPGADQFWAYLRESLREIGLTLIGASLSQPRDENELRGAMKTLMDQGAELLIVSDSPSARHHHRLIVALANEVKIPAIYPYREFFEAGGLFAYAIDLHEMFRGTADQIDQIFSGVDPGIIPIRQPTRFEFLINLNTARAIGLTIPPALLAQADEVID
jgi:ABC-type uncharacterized transport system substrate-binding protein